METKAVRGRDFRNLISELERFGDDKGLPRKPFLGHHAAQGSRRGTRKRETPASLRPPETKGPAPRAAAAARACAVRLCRSRLRTAPRAPPVPLSARGLNGLRVLRRRRVAGGCSSASASAGDSPSLGQKPSAGAGAGGAAPLRARRPRRPRCLSLAAAASSVGQYVQENGRIWA